MKFTLICATNNDKILQENLLSSPNINEHQLIILKNFTNVCKAYNIGMKEAENEIVLFVHQDVFLPETFFTQLEISMNKLNNKDWGVLGVAGVTNIKECDYVGYILDRGIIWGTHKNLPCEISTLDELLLILKRNSFTFDENIKNNHLFGTDICLQTMEKGKKNYSILAFCHHNSNTENVNNSDELPVGFQESKEYIKNKWKHLLPIYTTCTIIK